VLTGVHSRPQSSVPRCMQLDLRSHFGALFPDEGDAHCFPLSSRQFTCDDIGAGANVGNTAAAGEIGGSLKKRLPLLHQEGWRFEFVTFNHIFQRINT